MFLMDLVPVLKATQASQNHSFPVSSFADKNENDGDNDDDESKLTLIGYILRAKHGFKYFTCVHLFHTQKWPYMVQTGIFPVTYEDMAITISISDVFLEVKLLGTTSNRGPK